jgi:hypothetical protein
VVCFIGISGPRVSRQRVAMRVSQGGHDVPAEKLAARFPRALANLKTAIRELPHVWVFDNTNSTLVPTRQIIRFVSLASLFTGPGLSNFEMSFSGRNWAKVGKKLLQAGATPLANQLVDPTDSVLGPYSYQGGQPARPSGRRPFRNSTVRLRQAGPLHQLSGLIRQAFYPALWQNTHPASQRHRLRLLAAVERERIRRSAELRPFDGYVLALANGAVNPVDTNQFTQMEANVPLFFGLSVQAWETSWSRTIRRWTGSSTRTMMPQDVRRVRRAVPRLDFANCNPWRGGRVVQSASPRSGTSSATACGNSRSQRQVQLLD